MTGLIASKPIGDLARGRLLWKAGSPGRLRKFGLLKQIRATHLAGRALRQKHPKLATRQLWIRGKS